MKKVLFILIILVASKGISQNGIILNENTFSKGAKEFNPVNDIDFFSCRKAVKIRAYDFTSLEETRFDISVQGVSGVKRIIPGQNSILIKDNIYNESQTGPDVFITDLIEFKNYNSLSVTVQCYKKKSANTWSIKWVREFNIKKCLSQNSFKSKFFRFVTNKIDDIVSKCSNVKLPTGSRDLRYKLNVPKATEVVSGKIYKLYLNKSGRAGYYKAVTNSDITFGSEEGYFYTKTIENPIVEKSKDCDNNPSPTPTPEPKISDLSLLEKDVIASSNCSNCPALLKDLNPRFAGGAIPVNKHEINFKPLTTITLNMNITNVGDASSDSNVKINYYLSKAYNSLVGLKATKKSTTLARINAGNTSRVTTVLSPKDFGAPQIGSYFLVVDIEKSSNENKTTNNIINIPIQVKKDLAGKFSLTQEKVLNTSEPYLVSIYSIDGKIVKSEMVSNAQEEKALVYSINKSNGLFIVKALERTYKVIK